MKTLSPDGEAMYFLEGIFPKLTPTKVKAGIFNGPDIDKMLASLEFRHHLTIPQKNALDSLYGVVYNFLGNNRPLNFRQIVRKFFTDFKKINARMSIKMHFLHAHLDNFVLNCGAYSEQHGERFHQDILNMEKRYAGKNHVSMLSDHCWFLTRESPDYSESYKRDAGKNYFLKK